IDSQPSHDPILAKQRHRQKRTITQPPKHGPEPCSCILPLIEDIGDLDWLATGCRLTNRAPAELDRARPKRVYQLLFDLMAAPKLKFLRDLIVFINRSTVGTAQLDRVRGYARQYGFQVQSRANGLTDFTQRFQFSHRSDQFLCALLQLLQQPNVLNGDDGLIGERFEQLDLSWSEGAYLNAACDQYADEVPLLTKWNG